MPNGGPEYATQTWWERVVIQFPIVGALVFFGWSFLSHQQEMERLREKRGTDIEVERTDALRRLSEVLKSMERNEALEMQINERLLAAIEQWKTADDMRHKQVLAIFGASSQEGSR